MDPAIWWIISLRNMDFNFRSSSVSRVPVFPNRAARSLAGVNILCYNKISATGRIRLFSASMKASMKNCCKNIFSNLNDFKMMTDRCYSSLAAFFWKPTFFFFFRSKISMKQWSIRPIRWITEILFIPIPSWRWRRVWQTAVWLLPSASPNLSEFAGAAVILLCVRQPGQSPKGSPKLVQSARGSFPLISFRFPLKAMNTLNWHKRPHLIFCMWKDGECLQYLRKWKASPLAGLHRGGCSCRTKVCLCAERQRTKRRREGVW